MEKVEMTEEEEQTGKDRPKDISGIFEGMGEDTGEETGEETGEGTAEGGSGSGGDAGSEGWEQPTAPEGADAVGDDQVMDVFKFESAPERIPYRGGDPEPAVLDWTGAAAAAVPVASPVVTARKKTVAAEATGPTVKKEKVPPAPQLVEMAQDAYDNYNFLEASKLIKKAYDTDRNYQPGLDLFFELKRKYPHLFEEYGLLEDGRGKDDGTDPYDQDGHQPPFPTPPYGPGPGTTGGGVQDMTRREEPMVEKRDVGVKGLVNTRTEKVEKKVYHVPKTDIEQASGDVKKGYHSEGGGLGQKGGAMALVMGLVAMGVIVFALYWTGMIQI